MSSNNSFRCFHHTYTLLGLGLAILVAVVVADSLRSGKNPFVKDTPADTVPDKQNNNALRDGAPFSSGEEVRDEIGDIHAPIQATFEDKIVYGIADGTLDEMLLRDHCDKRGGAFNTCGSLCAEGEVCAQACALTCEF